MATFLMIHGAWHGGWCFEPLRPLLAKHGHKLISPNLPGTNGDTALSNPVTLELWAHFVADLVLREDEPVILCGHSRGGIVISSAAERAPTAFRSLVYLTAFMLPSGQSLRAFQMAVPNLAFGAALTPSVDGSTMLFDRAAAADLFYHRVPKAAQQEAIARLVPEPLQPIVTPLALSQDRFGKVPRHYIECTDDRAILIQRQRQMREILPCASVATLDSDHSPFLSCPDALTEALDNIARLK